MDIVIDTNVVLSGVCFHQSPSHEILAKVIDGEICAFCSKEIKKEYFEKIDLLKNSDKFKKKFKNGFLDLEFWKAFVNSLNTINVIKKVDICRDEKDNKFLECALEAECSFITSGDLDLLDLKEYQSIKILNPSEFLALYKEKGYEP